MREQAMVRFEVREGELDEAQKAIREFVDTIETKEPGTLFYGSYQDRDNPHQFVHLMYFRDGEAHKQHTGTDHVEAFVAKLYPLCVTTPQPTYLTEFDACGVLHEALKQSTPE